MWQRLLKDYFSFSSSDRNGFVVLISIIILVIILTYTLPRFLEVNQKSDLSTFKEIVTNFYYTEKVEEVIIHKELHELFKFDPNKLTREQMQRFGFNQQLSNTFENYIAAGGKFRNNEDVLKIFGMTDSIFEKLEPYMEIAAQVADAKPVEFEQVGAVLKPRVELNSADTSQLIGLPGIGSVLSARIIGYREILGGFHNINQLMEVYGISEEVFERLKALVNVEQSYIRKIDINLASFNELLRHPYINFDQARSISRFVQLNNNIHNLNELLENGVIDSISFYRILPYLKPIIE